MRKKVRWMNSSRENNSKEKTSCSLNKVKLPRASKKKKTNRKAQMTKTKTTNKKKKT